MTDKPCRISIAAYRTRAEGGTQIQIVQLDANGTGWGHRLAGPKHYNMGTSTLVERDLDADDAREIRSMLDEVFPPAPVDRWQALADALNSAGALGIDLDGTITDHDEHSVVWDRAAERWVVAAYDEDEKALCCPCGEGLDDENISDYCSDKCAALSAASAAEDGAL